MSKALIQYLVIVVLSGVVMWLVGGTHDDWINSIIMALLITILDKQNEWSDT